MSINRFDAKRDANEPEIKKHLEDEGFLVLQLKTFDLLVYDKDTGRLSMLEVKTKDGRLTKKQRELLMDGWPLRIVRTPKSALDAAKAGVMIA